MKKITSVLFGWMGMAILVASCTSPSDIRVERETVDLAFPIFTSETTISDLINDGQDSSALVVYADNQMGLVYETSTQVGVPMPEFENIEIALQSPITTVPNLPLVGVQVEKAAFNAGSLNFTFANNQYTENVKVVLRINQLSKNNDIFSKTINLNYDGNLPVKQDVSVDLSGYGIDVANSALKVEYQASLSDGSPATLEEAKMKMEDLNFKWIAGEWATKTLHLDIPSQEIGFFEHYTNSGSVIFTDPKLKITAQNNVGVGSKLVFNQIKVNTINNGWGNLNGDFFSSDFSLAHPDMNQMGSSVMSNTEINKNNSNVVEVFNAQAKRIQFDADYVVCPMGANKGFIADDSKVNVNMRVELPFEGQVNEFKVAKEFDVKFTNEHVKAAYLKLQAINQIPLDARIQMYFLDNADVILDSLVASNGMLAIEAADVNPLGSVIQTKEWQEEIKINQEKWEKIKGAVNVRLVTSFTSSSSAQVPVSIKANQQVRLNAGLKLVVLP